MTLCLLYGKKLPQQGDLQSAPGAEKRIIFQLAELVQRLYDDELLSTSRLAGHGLRVSMGQ